MVGDSEASDYHVISVGFYFREVTMGVVTFRETSVPTSACTAPLPGVARLPIAFYRVLK